MIYEIISKNDVPTSQMHIYLKNKTGDDGGIYPEIFHDLALKESVNGLYAFAIACVITNNFTDTSRFLKDYPSKEVATLGLIQYIKGMATTIQLNSECVNPRYNNLENIKQLGMSPTLLNLDGDLLYKHYDTTKYFSKEAADEAEDSFPYWVIKTVKEIKECTELMKPATKNFELPYYVQNISNEYIPIVNKVGSTSEEDIIGKIPPTGKEAIISIKDGYGKLGSSENAYILLSDKLQPVKHLVNMSELDSDTGTLKLPDGDFYVKCKKGSLICGRPGTNSNYNAHYDYSYTEGNIVHITGTFHNRGILENGLYVRLHSDDVYIVKAPEDHTKKEENPATAVGIGSTTPPIGPDCTYLVIIQMPSQETASDAIVKILKTSPYKNAYIDVDLDDKVTIVVYGDSDYNNAVKVKKKILAVFGYKALVIEYDKFYK